MAGFGASWLKVVSPHFATFFWGGSPPFLPVPDLSSRRPDAGRGICCTRGEIFTAKRGTLERLGRGRRRAPGHGRSSAPTSLRPPCIPPRAHGMKGGSFISSLSAASVTWLSWSRWRCGRPRRPRFVEPHPRVVGATNTNQTPLIRPALLPLSPQHNKTVLLNEAKVALNATKADMPP